MWHMLARTVEVVSQDSAFHAAFATDELPTVSKVFTLGENALAGVKEKGGFGVEGGSGKPSGASRTFESPKPPKQSPNAKP